MSKKPDTGYLKHHEAGETRVGREKYEHSLPHKFDKPARGSQSFGHPAHLRAGHLRNSGHSGAHRLGRRGK